jgi:hypothetical protein
MITKLLGSLVSMSPQEDEASWLVARTVVAILLRYTSTWRCGSTWSLQHKLKYLTFLRYTIPWTGVTNRSLHLCLLCVCDFGNFSDVNESGKTFLKSP